MIEKVIKALKDFDLRTIYGFHSLVEGEVKRIRFSGERMFESHLKSGNFVEAEKDEKESRNIPVIPVILPEVNEDTIVGIEPVDPVKLDLPCPREYQKPTAEELETILKQEGGSIEVLSNGEIQAVEVSTDEAGELVSKETPEDINRTESPIEELTGSLPEKLTPEQETEGQSEIEEIPIEEQDKSKPTRLSDIIDKP